MARGAHSIFFVVTGVALVFVVHVAVVIWALKWALRSRARRVGEQTDQEGGGCGGGGAGGLSAEEVGELPSHELKEGAAAGDCAVCLDAFRVGDQCRVLPGCDHGFHAECVDSWLRKSRRCPICRAVVVAGAVAEAAAVEIVTER
ncbi:hypothetical protein PR202_gb09690 [Eleusine coracana subsp. coracana]|uniref:RING-type domain-containing protein n=1 Tax=Eleusine coracana subsp. coracana TaxID=191504 RepID=A0AAV5EG82_ELECO|nr:hypothetical protein QOZ80_2BG0199740 [Eleusine coracana subsp. coracana]GJN22149.1 hypothetical protein PR202_gb09690 [Eleusine coracana subsp. coracana]